MISQQRDVKKPIFSDPPDQGTANINYIMTSLQNQQKHIMEMLSKYKQVLPDDQLIQQLNSKTERPHQIRRVQEIQKKSKSKNKKHKKSIDTNASIVRSVYANQYSKYSKNVNKTIQVERGTEERKSKTISLRNKESFSMHTGQAESVKLPLLNIKNKKQTNKQDLQYQKANRNYNQNVIKFYENIRNKPSRQVQQSKVQSKSIKNSENLKQRSKLKYKGKKLYENVRKDQYKSLPKGIQQGYTNKNQIDNQISAQQYLGIQHQIAKPISIRPYSNFTQIYSSKVEQSQGKRNSRVQNIKKRIGNQDDDQKPTEVAMSYYTRTLNEKLRQQSQQQINYLYFSKADQNDSNKQWAEQILRIFDRHDQQLEKMHINMKYLQLFDEAYFTAGIYETNKEK